MLSKKIFEQVDDLCKYIRKSDQPFGGIQVALFGDLYQLPPVPNHMYDDMGEIFVSSTRYKFHVYQLTTVHRQTEERLIKAVHELSRGDMSADTEEFMLNLKRDIPPGDPPMRLYALNYDVDRHNSDQLIQMEGEITTYNSSDTGELKRLSKLTVPKSLYLKLDAPVMLQVNLSKMLVNGLRGTVTSLENDSVQVYFPSLNKTETIKSYNFTVFDREKGKDVACRTQIPLRLSFAHTVHKAQGLTIDRLLIDCRHMSNPGQIGVAVGRATNIRNLRVLNFNRKLVKRHKTDIDDFYKKEFLPLHTDLTCCRSFYVPQESSEEIDTSTGKQESDRDSGSDSDKEFEYVLEAEENIQEMETEEVVHHVNYPLPSYIDIEQVLLSLKYDTPETPQQVNLNSNLQRLLSCLGQTKEFFDRIWNKLYSLYLELIPQEENVPQNKHITEFYKQITLFLQSPVYQEYVKSLFGTHDALGTDNYRTAFGIVEIIRATVISKKSEPYFAKAKEMASKKGQANQSKGSKAKVRYIGGWCLATLKYRKKIYVKNNLYKQRKKKDVDKVDKEVRCINMLTEDEEVLLKTAEDQDSLQEVRRKQNVRGGLTNITDETLEFFMLLDNSVQELETKENLNVHFKSFYTYTYNELINSVELKGKWRNLFHDDDECKVSECEDSINLLLSDVVSKYLKMSSAQFRMDYKRELQIEKEEAHRKNIRMRKEKQSRKVIEFRSFIEDKSEDRVKSHLRLQSELAGSSDFLLLFTKEQLLGLCNAYNLKTSSKRNKAYLCDLITEHVPKASGMVNPEKLQKPTTADESAGPSETGLCTSTLSTRRKTTGKGKGKAKKKRVSEFPCGICEKECEDFSVCCDECDTWYHFDCLKVLGDEEEFSDEATWFCNNCK